MKRFEIFFGIIKAPIDFIMSVLAFSAAYQLRLITEPIEGIAKPIDYATLPTSKEYFEFSVLISIALLVIFALGRMYNLRSTTNFTKETRQITTMVLIWVMASVTYFFFTRTFPFSRLAMIYSWTLAYMFILTGRGLIKVIQNGLLSSGIGRSRLVFIGNNAITEEIAESIANRPSYKIVGLIDSSNKKTTLKNLGSIKETEALLKRHRIDEVIQTSQNVTEKQSEDIIDYCDLNHINYRFIPDLIEVRRTNITIDSISGIPIISLKPTPLDGWGKVAKRALDIVGSLLGFIILSPIILITAIAIKLDSRGPVLFSRLDNGKPAERIGQYGKPFQFFKFRSMHPNTHSQRYKELAHKDTRKDSPLVKIKNDPRVTSIGQFIRKYSIDEIPQLWNVLIGHMSLVGPRPHLPEEVKKYEKHHRFVLTIKPGLTGLAQISGRSDLSFEEEVRLDRYYIENWSLLRDLKIIFRTLGVVLKGHQE